jgi:hypothetical protein
MRTLARSVIAADGEFTISYKNYGNRHVLRKANDYEFIIPTNYAAVRSKRTCGIDFA